MSAVRAVGRPVHSLIEIAVLRLFGPLWVALWLRVYPASGPAVRWTLHEEIAFAPPGRRWRRALALYAHLPQFASAQHGAESQPHTATGGEPPETPPPPPTSSDAAWSLGRVARALRDASVALAGGLVIVLSAVTALSVMGTLLALFDDERLIAAEIGVLAVILAAALLPIGVLLSVRPRLAWRPTERAEEWGPRWGWGVAVAATGLWALITYLAITAQFLQALDADPGQVVLAFGSAAGLGVLMLLFAAPLAYVVRRRYWRAEGDPLA